MPLLGGKLNIGKNISTEIAHGKPRRQAIAIALDVARRTGAKISKKENSIMRLPTRGPVRGGAGIGPGQARNTNPVPGGVRPFSAMSRKRWTAGEPGARKINAMKKHERGSCNR